MYPPKAVYIHIPFCASKCYYCDFTAYVVDGQPVDDYLSALEKEMEMIVATTPPVEINSIFIGGGTPTILTPIQMERLLSAIKLYFPKQSPEIEYTMEANPESTSPELIQVMLAGGVNRLSFGAQTFEPHLLQEIGRTHGVAEIAGSIQDARSAGFHNISLDLMFGLPHQTVDHMKETLVQAVALAPEHFSCYSLKVEEGTLFHQMEERGQLVLPTEEAEFSMYQLIRSFLLKAGYTQYEVSNFSRSAALESIHNSTYWRNKPYYGLGAGAHGYVDGVRYANVKGISEYTTRLKNGLRPIQIKETISIREQMENFFILGLRLLKGVNMTEFQQLYKKPAEAVFGEELQDLLKKNLLQINGDVLRLTEQGLLFGNDVFARFMSV